MKADGIVGDKTFEALGLLKYMSNQSSNTGSSNSSGNGAVSTSDEAYLLGKAIWAEAEGEPYIGKVAVGAVLLNRVDSPSFPNTLSGVIYQSNALESVSNGRFSTTADADCIRAAHDALNGWDPTYGCLYFWNPATATSLSLIHILDNISSKVDIWCIFVHLLLDDDSAKNLFHRQHLFAAKR